jgi:RNA polymerase sigma factor (sigma-70 family)
MPNYPRLSDGELADLIKKRDERAFNEIMARYEKPIFNLCYRMLQDYDDVCDAAQNAFVTLWKSIDNLKENDKIKTYLFSIAYNECQGVFRKIKNYFKSLSKKDDSAKTSDKPHIQQTNEQESNQGDDNNDIPHQGDSQDNGDDNNDKQNIPTRADFPDNDDDSRSVFKKDNANEIENIPDPTESPIEIIEQAQRDRTIKNEIKKLSKNEQIVIFLFYYEGFKTREIEKILGEKESAVKSRLKRAREKLKNNPELNKLR